MANKPKCMGWTSRPEFRNNLPCGNNAQPGSQYCKLHDPKLIEARDTARMERINQKRKDALLSFNDEDAK